MGRKYAEVISEHQFIPRISETSKKLAQKLKTTRADGDGIPHFMLSTKARQVNLEPLKEPRSPVNSVTNESIKESELDARNAGAVIVKKEHKPNKKILPHLASLQSSKSKKSSKGSNSPTSSSSDVNNDNQNNSADTETLGNGMSGFTNVEFSDIPTKNLDQAVFTFHPKVSSASLKIVENLGSNFMTRQQQHIERQKKIVSQ